VRLALGFCALRFVKKYAHKQKNRSLQGCGFIQQSEEYRLEKSFGRDAERQQYHSQQQ